MNRIPKPTEVRYYFDRAYLNGPMRIWNHLPHSDRVHCMVSNLFLSGRNAASEETPGRFFMEKGSNKSKFVEE